MPGNERFGRRALLLGAALAAMPSTGHGQQADPMARTLFAAMPRKPGAMPTSSGVATMGGPSNRFAYDDHVHPGFGQARVLFSKTGLNLNTTADQLLTPSFAFTDCLVREVVLSNVSLSLSLSLAQIGLFTGPGATGVTLVTAGLIQGLTAAAKILPLTLQNGRLAGGTLYARLSVAHGATATCDVHVLGVPLA